MCICAELERNDNEALRNVAICPALLHSRVAELRRSLLDTTDSIVGFDENIAVVVPGQTRGAWSDQVAEGDTVTGGAKD